MGTKAYLLVNLDKRHSDDGYYLDAARELSTIPEVESVESVSGICDLLVKVDAPIKVIFVANKILAKEWVKGLRILRVEPTESEEAPKHITREQLKQVLARRTKAATT